MRVRLKIVPDDDPNVNGRWITRRVPSKFCRPRMDGLFHSVDWDIPTIEGHHVVDYRMPRRNQTRKRKLQAKRAFYHERMKRG